MKKPFERDRGREGRDSISTMRRQRGLTQARRAGGRGTDGAEEDVRALFPFGRLDVRTGARVRVFIKRHASEAAIDIGAIDCAVGKMSPVTAENATEGVRLIQMASSRGSNAVQDYAKREVMSVRNRRAENLRDSHEIRLEY